MNSTNRARDLHKNVPADWYQKSIQRNLLQRFWHKTRFKEVKKLIESVEGKVLDIGSADGTFTKVILESSGAKKIIGIDVLAGSVSFAKKRFARSKKLSFFIADAHKLPFKNKEFDAVFCLETMEHVENPKRVISEIKRVLQDNGYVLVLIPSENWLFRLLVWPLWTTFGPGRIWRDTHLHKFKSDQIVNLLENANFSIQRNHKFLLGMLQAVKARKQ